MRDLNVYLNEAKHNLDLIGIKYGEVESIVPNIRAHSRWGQCKRLPNGNFSININVELMDETKSPTDMGLKNTVMHELLHTVSGAHGHTGVWENYANKVNSVYNLGITRCSTVEEKGVIDHTTSHREIDNHKYCVECSKCGHRWYYSRMGSVVKYPGECTHTKDGGCLKRVW